MLYMCKMLGACSSRTGGADAMHAQKNMKLRTVVYGCQHNDNTVKDVTPLPDQDIICLEQRYTLR